MPPTAVVELFIQIWLQERGAENLRLSQLLFKLQQNVDQAGDNKFTYRSPLKGKRRAIMFLPVLANYLMNHHVAVDETFGKSLPGAH